MLESSQISTPLTICSPNALNFLPDDSYETNTTSFVCLPDGQNFMSYDYVTSEILYNFVSIYLMPCSNDSDSAVICQSQDTINKIISNSMIDMWISENVVDATVYHNPISVSLSNFQIYLDPNFYKSSNSFFLRKFSYTPMMGLCYLIIIQKKLIILKSLTQILALLSIFGDFQFIMRWISMQVIMWLKLTEFMKTYLIFLRMCFPLYRFYSFLVSLFQNLNIPFTSHIIIAKNYMF